MRTASSESSRRLVRRRSVLTIGMLCAAAFSCSGNDLRQRIEAAGVYSPARSDLFRREVADLGQLLFFDPELSGNRNVACSSCHLPIDHAGDAHPLGRSQGAVGAGHARVGGEPLPRNVISPFNRSFAQNLLWDGRVERLPDGSIRAPVPLPDGIETLLEAQALLPLLEREEMRGYDGDLDVNGDPNELAAIPDDDPQAVWDAVMARLMAIEEYRERFAAAFPTVPKGEHTIVHAVRAIARFEMRLWELTDTPFDRYLGSEHREPAEEALFETARRGAELFFGDAGCDRCHNGPLLSDDSFHNIGVPPFGPGKANGIDEGRFLVTGDPADRFAFRTPPLRNVDLTGPYMHNGTVGSLYEAIWLHIEPESALDARAFTAPDGTFVEIDPEIAEQIRATIDHDVRPLRRLSEEEIWALEEFLRSLSSDTEMFGLPLRAGEPDALPSGLPVQGSDLRGHD